MHIEDKPDPARNALHVIGRTYDEPHRYFYRRYAYGTWTPWEPVGAEVEGDHLAPVIWRDRLYLFWVTFLEKAQVPQGKPTAEPLLTDLKISDLAAATKPMTIEVHLHWSELVDGQWTKRASAGPLSPTPIVRTDVIEWDPREVFIHVSREPLEDGEERGVYVHLSGQIYAAFYLASRNSAPEKVPYGGPEDHFAPRPAFPVKYNTGWRTRFRAAGSLEVSLRKKIVTTGGEEADEEAEDFTILAKAGSPRKRLEGGSPYDLITGNSDIAFATPEIAALIKPFFYQDRDHTFFAEPELTETTTESWTGWIAKNPGIVFDFDRPELENYFDRFVIVAGIPERKGPPVPQLDGIGLFEIDDRRDWLINEVTGLLHEGEVIGPEGREGVTILPVEDAADMLETGGTRVEVRAGSDVLAGTTLVKTSIAGGGLVLDHGIDVVGKAGVKAGLLDGPEFGGQRP